MPAVLSATAIRPFVSGDLPELARFLAQVYPGWQADMDAARAYYAWKYCDLSGRDTAVPVGYVLDAAGEIVGFLGCLPFLFRREGVPLQAAWICDWHVAGGMRGYGFGWRLLECAIRDIPVLACVGGTADAVRLFRTSGFRYSENDREWRQVLRPLAFEWPRRTGWRRFAALPRALQHCATDRRIRSRIAQGLTIGAPVQPSRLGALVGAECSGPVRHRGYLEWMMRSPYAANEIRPFVMRSELVGWTMLSTGIDALGRRNSRVLELKVTDTELRQQAWNLCSSLLRSLQPVYVTTMAACSEASTLEAAGYQPRSAVGLWVRHPDRNVTIPAASQHVTLLDKDNAFRGQSLIP